MRTIIPELTTTRAFEPEDLLLLQRIFENACNLLSVPESDQTRRRAIAVAIFNLAKRRSLDEAVLLEAALVAGKQPPEVPSAAKRDGQPLAGATPAGD